MYEQLRKQKSQRNSNSLSANTLDLNQDRQNVDPDLGPYYLVLNENYGAWRITQLERCG